MLAKLASESSATIWKFAISSTERWRDRPLSEPVQGTDEPLRVPASDRAMIKPLEKAEKERQATIAGRRAGTMAFLRQLLG